MPWGIDNYGTLCPSTDIRLGTVPPASEIPPLPPITTLPSGTLLSTAMSDTTNSTATSLMSLLLPQSEASKERNIFIGDGLPSIPPKLYRRMLNWSYIDMAELQPLGSIECQNPEPDPARYVILPGLELAKAKKKVVLDIHTWIRCFAIYLTVMATKQPTVLPELVAYMLFIIRIQREYEEPVWRFYDEAFRDKAAATGNKKWSMSDQDLCNRLLTGRARSLQMCTNCNHIGHETNACPVAASTAGKQFGRARSPETEKVGLPLAKRRAPSSASGVCWEFNYEGRCSYEVCKFRHVCQICQGRHPGIHCTKYGNTRVLSGKRRPGDKAMGYKEFMTQK